MDSISSLEKGGGQMDSMPSLEKGPERGDHYNASYGYEPYWADGEWLFDKQPDHKSDPEHMMCQEQCTQAHKQFGVVCGRDKNLKQKTFKNYCALKNEDCSGREGWMIRYRGKCAKWSVYEGYDFKPRVGQIINSFMNAHTGYENFVGVYKPRTQGLKLGK